MLDAIATTIESTNTYEDECLIWMRVWSDLALQLKRLQCLQLWLGIDDISYYWFSVDEPTILSPFFASISPNKIAGLTDVSINLPFIYPLLENPERHLTEGGPAPPAFITIKREMRQRYHHFVHGIGQEAVTFEGMNIDDAEAVQRELLEEGADYDALLWYPNSLIRPY
ncbi:hypothetical protein F4818DRAFT_112153 [Hypoxylon cercidicola]|nr:hypothetical protein F4818DRAFT_112153 [Hypoxylon cercidicola]